MLYIFWFLHQTTTCGGCDEWWVSCISFDSYIKPQLARSSLTRIDVVYLLIPTSNHNLLHYWPRIYRLYIFWFLHQTTTPMLVSLVRLCCISFDSYIKPQLFLYTTLFYTVVYLLIPTSNHNLPTIPKMTMQVVYLLIPTSNHNLYDTFQPYPIVVYLLIPTSNHNPPHQSSSRYLLYIFWFLHQTTTRRVVPRQTVRCISFDSYIKPQRFTSLEVVTRVVYLLIPTSNHNLYWVNFWVSVLIAPNPI